MNSRRKIEHNSAINFHHSNATKWYVPSSWVFCKKSTRPRALKLFNFSLTAVQGSTYSLYSLISANHLRNTSFELESCSYSFFDRYNHSVHILGRQENINHTERCWIRFSFGPDFCSFIKALGFRILIFHTNVLTYTN